MWICPDSCDAADGEGLLLGTRRPCRRVLQRIMTEINLVDLLLESVWMCRLDAYDEATFSPRMACKLQALPRSVMRGVDCFREADPIHAAVEGTSI